MTPTAPATGDGRTPGSAAFASSDFLLPRIDVGGQAVIEGVMMRSPRSFAVVCRRPDETIAIREEPWQPLWAGARVLRWPFVRGSIVLVESLWNGLSALTFAAEQQSIEAPAAGERGAGAPAAPTISPLAKAGMLITSLAFGLALFVGVPHLLSWFLGSRLGYDASSVTFHAVDGVIKVALLIGYLAAISTLPDIRRVFQYHGAEHKSIWAYERGLALTVDNARAQSRFHPRCGTSFLFIVVGVSIAVFATLLDTRLAESATVDHVLKILIKLPLMLPVAGLAYEILKWSGRHVDDPPGFPGAIARALARPGLWLQKITTREPGDAELQIALLAIRTTLAREEHPDAPRRTLEILPPAGAAPSDVLAAPAASGLAA